MNRWAMNLSTDQYNRLIKKKNFVNEWMSYNIAMVSLPDRRIFIRMTIDVYGPVPTLTAIQEYLGYKVNLNPETLAIGNQLQMDIEGQFFISHEWLPNVADYCYFPLKDQNAFKDYFRRIFTLLSEKDRYILFPRLLLENSENIEDYKDTEEFKHEFDTLSKGLIDIVNSYPPMIKAQLIGHIVGILQNQHYLDKF